MAETKQMKELNKVQKDLETTCSELNRVKAERVELGKELDEQRAEIAALKRAMEEKKGSGWFWSGASWWTRQKNDTTGEDEVVVEGCHTVGCCVGIVVDQVNDFVVSLGKKVGLKWEKKGGDGEDGEDAGDDKVTKYLILGVVGSVAVHVFMAGFFYSRQMLDLLYNVLEILYFIPYVRLIVMVLVGILKWVGVGIWELAKEERKRADKRR